MATLTVLVAQEQGEVPVTVLRVEGDIDAATHGILEDKASEVISGGADRILLDLGGVPYMGSAGFRAIHAINNMLGQGTSAAQGKSEHLKLLNPSPEISRVIKTLGFDVFLEIYQDRRAAIQSF